MVKKSPKGAFNDSNLNIPSQEMVNNFNYAARDGDDKAVEAFLDKYPHAIDAKADNGMNALMAASAHGQKRIAEILLEKGADPDVKTAHGRIALQFANREGQRYIAALLQQASEEKKRRLAVKPSQEKVNAFCFAARTGDSEAVAKFLKSYPYSIDAKEDSGMTALMYASANGEKSTVELLLKNNATADKKTSEGWTALRYAKRYGQRDIEALLEQKTQEQAAVRELLAGALKKGTRGKQSPGRK
jgi:ankyrin repeat protein